MTTTRYLITRPTHAMPYGGGYVLLPVGAEVDCELTPEELAAERSDRNVDGMDVPNSVDVERPVPGQPGKTQRLLIAVDDLRERASATAYDEKREEEIQIEVDNGSE